MKEKERHRKAVFEMVRQRRLTLTQASAQCGLSYRQTLRVYQKYLRLGDAGLTHQSRGQRSTRKHPHQEAIIALYREIIMPDISKSYLKIKVQLFLSQLQSEKVKISFYFIA